MEVAQAAPKDTSLPQTVFVNPLVISVQDGNKTENALTATKDTY